MLISPELPLKYVSVSKYFFVIIKKKYKQYFGIN